MHQFRNDYSEGACPEVLEALIQTNAEQTPGYGTDEHCERAAALLREVCGQPAAYVRFIPGGTAANAVCISAFTDDFEGPILAADAHPTAHETGAIEACGRRILATADAFGVLAPAEVERVYHASIAGGCHTTRPAMLYFSNTSELGHVYTRAEFDSLCDVAEKLDLAVYVDGARMASALTAADGDLTLEHLASRADAFTLGGTKAGMLFGEALVVSPRTARGRRAIERIPYLTKRSGHMTAKGRLMGIQYEAVFDPELRDAEGLLPYFTHAKRSNECAVMLANGLERRLRAICAYNRQPAVLLVRFRYGRPHRRSQRCRSHARQGPHGARPSRPALCDELGLPARARRGAFGVHLRPLAHRWATDRNHTPLIEKRPVTGAFPFIVWETISARS